MDLPILDNSQKWNPTILSFWVWLLSLSTVWRDILDNVKIWSLIKMSPNSLSIHWYFWNRIILKSLFLIPTLPPRELHCTNVPPFLCQLSLHCAHSHSIIPWPRPLSESQDSLPMSQEPRSRRAQSGRSELWFHAAPLGRTQQTSS